MNSRRLFNFAFTLIISSFFFSLAAIAANDDGPSAPKGTLNEVSPWLIKSRSNTQIDVIYSEDFENSPQRWKPTGDWKIGSPKSGPQNGHASSQCAATNLNGKYSNQLTSILTSPLIKLPELDHPKSRIYCQFQEWLAIESEYDFGELQISNDNGANWTTLSRSHGSSDWRFIEAGLTHFAEQSILLRFQFISDESDSFDGWHIDDISIIMESRDDLSATLLNLSSVNFPNIYMAVGVSGSGGSIGNLDETNFTVFENDVNQTGSFTVIPPAQGGGIRLADIVFLMDNSGSMDGEQDEVENNVVNFVTSLEESDVDFALGLCRFGQELNDGYPIVEDNGILTRDIDYFTNNVWQRNVIDGGNESGWDAIIESLNQFSFRAGATKILILITDETINDDGITSIYTHSDAESALLNNTATLFGLLDIDSSHCYDDYGSLCDASNGSYYDIYSDFVPILDQISEIVSDTYTISYYSSNPAVDEVERLVLGEVTTNGLTAYFEGSYTPGASPVIQRTVETIDLHDRNWADDTSFSIKAHITDFLAPYVESARLYYRTTGNDEAYSSTLMTNVYGNVYEGIINPYAVSSPGIDYFITATDGFNTSSDPTVGANANPYQIGILPNESPEITHTAIVSAIVGEEIQIEAVITDDTNELDWAQLNYRQVGQLNYQIENMTSGSGNQFTSQIPSSYVTAAGVEYFLKAQDDFGLARELGTPDEPLLIRADYEWPDDPDDPHLTFKIVQYGGSIVTRAKLYGDIDWGNPNEKNHKRDLIDLYEVPVHHNYATFSKAALVSAMYYNEDRSYEIKRIEFLDNSSRIIAHMDFHYTALRWYAEISTDAIIYIHNDLSPMPQSNPYPGWDYYVPGEYQASMLIPPERDIINIDSSKQPTLFVHGVGGSYPYWGSPIETPEPTPDRLYLTYDTWQFYYPYDQPIVNSSVLLDRAIDKLLQNGGINHTGTYNSGKINIVAHSMGGLVTRSLIQSDQFDSNINKFLMFATPNHGSYVAWEAAYGSGPWNDILAAIMGTDREAPAYVEMIMGSNYFYDLFSSQPKTLGSGVISKDYLVIAGTHHIPVLTDNEIIDQQDGCVSVSSASLLEYNIPLGLIDAVHTKNNSTGNIEGVHTHNNSDEIASVFFDDSYDPNSNMQDVDCWRTSLAGDCDGISDAGLITMRLNSTNAVDYHMAIRTAEPNTIIISTEDMSDTWPWQNEFMSTDGHKLRHLSGTNQFFSRNTDWNNDCSVFFNQTNSDPANSSPYDLEFNTWIGECRPITHIPDVFSFHHHSTSMLVVNLDNQSAIALNSNNCSPLFPSTGRGVTEFPFFVDSEIDSLVFILSNGKVDPSFNNHSMVLTTPSGSIISPDTANNNPSVSFNEDVEYGLASYMITIPETGQWQVQVNNLLVEPKVAAYYTAGLEVALTATEVAYPDSIEIIAEVIGGGSCVNEAAVVEYAISEKGSLRLLGEIELTEKPGEQNIMHGWIVPEKAGTYYLSMSYGCDQGQSNPIIRQAFTSTEVLLATGPETDGPVSDETIYFFPNPINPTFETGQFRFSLSEAATVTITIYDASNKVVKTIDCGYQVADTEIACPWDCKNKSGSYVANGVYFYVIESSAGERGVSKLAVLK
jgi:pimeloyl-ACP methyl ester carboxylesterase